MGEEKVARLVQRQHTLEQMITKCNTLVYEMVRITPQQRQTKIHMYHKQTREGQWHMKQGEQIMNEWKASEVQS